MVNITDVARHAGVSVATVSRVINNSSSVIAETREKVLKSIEELGYNPNGVARNLRRRNTKIIIVILPSITNTFYSKVVRGIEDRGRINGYNVLLCTTGNDKKLEMLYLDMIKAKQADGVIFMYSTLNENELRQFGMLYPSVQCSEYKENTGIPYVSIDNILAASEVTEHFICDGHKNIAMISENKVGSSLLRQQGYLNVLHKYNMTDLIEYGDYSYNSGYKATQNILQKKPDTTAIFAISDIMAMGSMRASIDMNLKIPQDIAVSGFDNILFSHMFSPELTTISQPRYQMGENAMRLLIEQIDQGKRNQDNIIMQHKLIIRESSKFKRGD